MSDARAVIVGGGIGGLTAAAALRDRGWSVRVIEQAAALEPVGFAIGLSANALRAFTRIGIADDVRAEAGRQEDGGLRRPDGTWLVYSDARAIAERFGDPVSVITRPRLVELLTQRLPADAITLNTTVTDVDAGDRDRPARVCTTDGEHAADLVVAADGLASVIRSRVFGDPPGTRYAGYTAWRFLAPDPGEPIAPAETWGRGARFAAVPLADGRWYCYATANVPPGGRADDEHAELLRRFSSWHDPIPRLLGLIGPEEVIRHDIEELAAPLPRYHYGRVALLGDAAHAMTPNLGQGGCQAIEDGVTLAALVGPGAAAEPDSALRQYTAARRPRTVRMLRRSRRLGAIAQWHHPLAVGLRDQLFRLNGLVPARLTARSLAALYDWHPPRPAEASTVER